MTQHEGFHFTDLSAFRQRLLQHGQERWLFDKLIEQLQARGLLQTRGQGRTDATPVVALMNRLSQLELVRETLRSTLKALAGVAADWGHETLPQAFSERYAQRQNDYRLSDRQITAQWRPVRHEGYWLLARLDRGAPVVACALSEVQVLRTVLAQQFPQGPEQGPTANRPAGRGVIETPHDPQVRGSKKGGTRWLGFKAQITESCDDDAPSLIVDVEATEATTYDGALLEGAQERMAQQGMVPQEQYVDQSYTSGENLARRAQRGMHLLGRPQEDHGAPAGYRQADFQIDEGQREAIYPHGQRSGVWSERQVAKGALSAVQIRFAGPICQACPAFGQCTECARALVSVERVPGVDPSGAGGSAERRLSPGLSATLSPRRDDLGVRAGAGPTVRALPGAGQAAPAGVLHRRGGEPQAADALASTGSTASAGGSGVKGAGKKGPSGGERPRAEHRRIG